MKNIVLTIALWWQNVGKKTTNSPFYQAQWKFIHSRNKCFHMKYYIDLKFLANNLKDNAYMYLWF
jgi:hypothetical protein